MGNNLGWESIMGTPPSVYPEGRSCAYNGCDTVLSMYNKYKVCAKCYKKVLKNGEERKYLMEVAVKEKVMLDMRKRKKCLVRCV